MESTMKIPCPDEETLVDYLEGRLLEKQRFEVEAHLSDCQTCLEAVVITNDLLRSKPQFELNRVPPRLTEVAVDLVASQISSSKSGSLITGLKRSTKRMGSKACEVLGLRPWGIWQFSSIRGSKTMASEDFVSLRVPFREVDSDIDIEKTASHMANIRVTLRHPGKRTKPIRITLKEGQREIASYLSDSVSVLFEDIPFGRYSVSLSRNGFSLGTYIFEIKESRHGQRQG